MFMNLSVVHFNKAIAAHSETAIVRGHQKGYALSGHKIEQKIEDHAAGLFVERARRLIGKQNLRFVHQSAAERRALALPDGKFLDAMVETVREPGALRELQKARLCRTAVDACGNRGDIRQFSARVRSGMRLWN
jgi:hypothetical protein